MNPPPLGAQIVARAPNPPLENRMEGWLQKLSPKLSGKNRRELRAMAHHLKAIVIIGHNGLTDGIVPQVTQALEDHELIKVKILSAYTGDIKTLAAELIPATSSQLAGKVGRHLIIYRARDKDPQITLSPN